MSLIHVLKHCLLDFVLGTVCSSYIRRIVCNFHNNLVEQVSFSVLFNLEFCAETIRSYINILK